MKFVNNYLVVLLFLLIATEVFAKQTKIKITVDNKPAVTATLEDNSSSAALIELLKKEPLTIAMQDYGSMEKVGNIGTSLPRNDEQITTEPGDIILYQGSALVIYYEPNSWNFTRLGKIDNLSQSELKTLLGKGDVTVKIELANATKIEHRINDDELYKIINLTSEYVEVSGTFDTLSLMDLNGKYLITTKKNSLNIGHISAGIYYLKIMAKDNRTVLKKILKI